MRKRLYSEQRKKPDERPKKRNKQKRRHKVLEAIKCHQEHARDRGHRRIHVRVLPSACEPKQMTPRPVQHGGGVDLAQPRRVLVRASSAVVTCHHLPRIKTFPSNNYVQTRWDRSTEHSHQIITSKHSHQIITSKHVGTDRRNIPIK
jgi:hypothetical protein